MGNIIANLINEASDSTLLSETAGDENNVRIANANDSGPKNLADLIVIAAEDLCFKYQVWPKERAQLFAEEFVRLHPGVAQGGELKERLAAGK